MDVTMVLFDKKLSNYSVTIYFRRKYYCFHSFGMKGYEFFTQVLEYTNFVFLSVIFI